NLNWSQPIEQRVKEIIAGDRSAVVVKLFGDDFNVLAKKAGDVEKALKDVRGATDVKVSLTMNQPVLQVRLKQDELARYGVPEPAVLGLVESVGSYPLGEVIDGVYRFPLVARLPEPVRGRPESLGSLLVTAPDGERIPLARLATLDVVEAPSTVEREWGQR